MNKNVETCIAGQKKEASPEFVGEKKLKRFELIFQQNSKISQNPCYTLNRLTQLTVGRTDLDSRCTMFLGALHSSLQLQAFLLLPRPICFLVYGDDLFGDTRKWIRSGNGLIDSIRSWDRPRLMPIETASSNVYAEILISRIKSGGNLW